MNTMLEQSIPIPACEIVAPSLAALALGAALDPDEQELALAHLALCAACRRRLDGYASVTQLLPLAAPEADPSFALKDRILGAAAALGPAPNDIPAAPSPAPTGPRVWWRWLVGPAMALALLLLLAGNVAQAFRANALQESIARQQTQSATYSRLVIAAFGNDDALEATLLPSGEHDYASARVFISPGEPAVAIYARNMPQLPPEQTYQLWVAHDGEITSAGRFAANDEGRVWRSLQPAEQLGQVERVFVTVEPADGSAQPTGPEYLSGTASPAV
jgi:hypothetical protein